MTRRPPRLALPALALALSGAPASARADGDDADAVAKKLYDEGTAAMDQGDFATACPLLEEVARLKPSGIGAKLTVAECYESVGRLASALKAYAAAEALATSAGQADRRARAAAHVATLRARVGTATIDVPPAARGIGGLEITFDGAALEASQWSVAVPVDPGRHTVRASAPGHAPFVGTFEARDGARAALSIELAPLATPRPEEPAPPPKASPPPVAGSSPPPPEKPAPASPAAPRSLVVPVVAAGAAVVGYGAAVGAFIGLRAEHRTADAECDPAKRCTIAGYDAVRTGRVYDVVGTAGFAVGTAAIVGLGAWLLWPHVARRPRAATTLEITPLARGAAIGGRF